MTHSCNFWMCCNHDTKRALSDTGIEESFSAIAYTKMPGREARASASTIRLIEAPLRLQSRKDVRSSKTPHGSLMATWVTSPRSAIAIAVHAKMLSSESMDTNCPNCAQSLSDYLDKWIDYCEFKCKSVGSFYGALAKAGHDADPA